MTVAYVLRYYPTLSETFVLRELAGLQRRGIDVVVVAIGSRPDGALQDEAPDVEVLRPPRGAVGRLRTGLAWGREGPREELRALASVQRLRDAARVAWVARALRGRGVERVHAHFAGEAAEWARALGALLGVPYSVTAHAVDLFRPRPSCGAVLAAARPAITVCSHHQSWIRARYGVAATVVRCGVDPARYDLERSARVPSEPLRIVSVARYAPKKGMDTLLAAVEASQVPVRLRLVSDAPRSLQSPLVDVGPLAPSAVPAALAAADVFALPCRVAPDGDRDGIPVAMIEAMASGVPVIGTPVAGVPELVDARVGWLVPPDDPAALAEAFALASDDAEREQRGRAARARVRASHTLAQQVDGLLAAWRAS